MKRGTLINLIVAQPNDLIWYDLQSRIKTYIPNKVYANVKNRVRAEKVRVSGALAYDRHKRPL